MRENEQSDRLDRALGRRLYYRELYDSLFDATKLNTTKFRNKTAGCKFYAGQLFKLECFVDELLSNDEIPFVPYLGSDDRKKYDPSSLAGQYFRLIPGFIDAVNMLSPNYEYSERINVLITCCKSMGLLSERLDWRDIWIDPPKNDLRFSGASAAEIFNTLVNAIRSEWKTNNIQAKVNARKKETNKRYAEYCQYVDALFDETARLVVLRIDLYYKKQYTSSMTVADIRKDLDHLLENKRCHPSLFGSMKGYIAKLEYGVDKGMHWHVLFFLDGSERRTASHIHFTEEIGDYWNDMITKGLGDYWNVNANAKTYDKLGRRGVGVINWHDADLIRNLKEFVIEYLCKMDQFIKPNFGPKVRLFRRGNFPKKPAKKLGRPRMTHQNQERC